MITAKEALDLSNKNKNTVLDQMRKDAQILIECQAEQGLFEVTISLFNKRTPEQIATIFSELVNAGYEVTMGEGAFGKSMTVKWGE